MKIKRMKRIVICGGGNLGHSLAAMFSIRDGYSVSLLTRDASKWSNKIHVHQEEGGFISNEIQIFDKPGTFLSDADIIVLALPSFALQPVLNQIKDYVRPQTWIGSIICSAGFFWMAKKILGLDVKLFGFQRTPHICRVNEYGKSVFLKGVKDSVKIIASPISEDILVDLAYLLNIEVIPLSNYLEVTISNSNPILHPSRLMSLFYEQKTFESIPSFYEDWNDKASEYLIEADTEVQAICASVPVELNDIAPITNHYGVDDVKGMTSKIKSILAFKNIPVVMKTLPSGEYVPDFEHRYFTEDIPYGLLILKSIAVLCNLKTPVIDKILLWGQNCINKEFINTDGELVGKDLCGTTIPQNYGINNLKDLVNL